MLPLSTWKRLVHREYLPGAVQAERINAWRQQYIIDEGVFVDTSTAGRVRTLVRGGVEGLAEFEKQLISQVELMNKDMLSDPPGEVMYVEVGKTKTGLTIWRCKRGSSKNEAANLVLERSLHTTARMTQATATGIAGDRFARFNHDVKLSQLKAQLKQAGQPITDVAHFDHSMDCSTQLRVNTLCQQLGFSQPYPFLDPSKLSGPAQPRQQFEEGDSDDEAVPEHGQEDESQDEQEQQGPVTGAEQQEGPADWDEGMLDWSDGSDMDLDLAAAPAAVPGQQEQQQQPGLQQQQRRQQVAAAAGAANPASVAPPAAATPGRRRRSAAAAEAVVASPRAGLARAAAAKVAELVAQQLQGDSDQEDSQPARKRRRAANSDSYSGDDQLMEDVDSPVQPPKKQQRQQQQQQPPWVADRVATPLPAAEVVGPVQGVYEEALFGELLPQFAGGSSSSKHMNPLRLPANSIDFLGMTDAWNSRARVARPQGKLITFKMQKQLKDFFTQASSQHKQGKAQQQAQAGAAAAAHSDGAAAAATAAGDAAAAAAAAVSDDTAAAPSAPTGVVQDGMQAAAVAAAGQTQQRAAWRVMFQGAAAPNTGVSKGSSQQAVSKQPAKGTGRGGAGAKKICVPCTLKAMKEAVDSEQLPRDTTVLSANAARVYAGGVQMTTQHANSCPFCKCADCKKAYSKKGSLNPDDFLLAAKCQGSKKRT